MDFDFLPNLPKSNLDDRTFEELVEECLLRIPRYCPEWTNYNPSDPGITIVELFAWLTDQMLMRFNQVPRRNYVAFLELLGIHLQPPQPAKTNLTFYLSTARSENPIEAGTEVATERMDTDEPIIFSTDSNWIIGTPQIASLLTATEKKNNPSEGQLNNLFRIEQINEVDNEGNREWVVAHESSDASMEVFKKRSGSLEPGACFYLVLTPQPLTDDDSSEEDNKVEILNSRQLNRIAGNVIAITFKGREAATTGIDPNNPPRIWEVWDGREWVSKNVLRRESDDRTKGFSFERSADSPKPEQGADVILHLPLELSEEDFGTEYRGYWLRCSYMEPKGGGYGYDRSPQITSVSVRSIGATIPASHCTWIKDEEFLGISNGKPGQTFELLNKPILLRNAREYIEVRSPIFQHSREIWKEVDNFSSSDENSCHYTIDSHRGIVQFGPLVREPNTVQGKTQQRYDLQNEFQPQLPLWQHRRNSALTLPTSELNRGLGSEERQYGKIPPKGWEIYMVAYRTGGGSKGNVKAQMLQKLMISKPYIRSVTNYESAKGGVDAESLERAVMRVPGFLRTGDRAVTREDFEALAKRVEDIPVDRTRCLEASRQHRGKVTVLVIPKVELNFDFYKHRHETCLELPDFERKQIQAYLNDRALLGTYVEIKSPKYIRICAQIALGISELQNRERQEKLITDVKLALYRFLHPTIGGFEGRGWEFDRPVLTSDIATCCQKITGVKYIREVRLFKVERQSERFDYPNWQAKSIVELAPNEMVCSWQDGTEKNSDIDANGSLEIQI